MYLDRKFGLSVSLRKMTLLFDLSPYLDRTLAQQKAKSKVKVTHCVQKKTPTYIFFYISQNSAQIFTTVTLNVPEGLWIPMM